MGNVTRGNTSGLIAWPRAVAHKMYLPAINTNLRVIPDLNALDGSTWLYSGTSGVLSRYSALGTLIFTITPASDINAAATFLLGIYVDYTDSKLYMIFNSGTNGTLFFASTPLTTKTLTITTLSTSFTATTVGVDLGYIFIDRPGGQGTGNLRMYVGFTPEYRDVSAAGVLQGVTTSMTLSGVSLQNTLSFYFSSTATIRASIPIGVLNTTAIQTNIIVNRNGGTVIIPTSRTNNAIYSFATVVPIVNGTFVCMFGNDQTAVTYASIPKTFVRADFDSFISLLADAGGCP